MNKNLKYDTVQYEYPLEKGAPHSSLILIHIVFLNDCRTALSQFVKLRCFGSSQMREIYQGIWDPILR